MDSRSETAVKFFYEHGGYSYGQGGTKEQGRLRCARALAEAEAYASAHGWRVCWSDDWSIGDHAKEYDCYEDGGPETCEHAALYTADGTLIGSLSCIDDASTNYRRVVEAELASEAMHSDPATLPERVTP